MRFKMMALAGFWAFSNLAWAEADFSLTNFPRLAGETNDTARLQRAINAARGDGVLYIPRGIYEVSAPIIVTNGASLLLHKSATIRAVAKMDYVFHIDLQKCACWRSPRATLPNIAHDCNYFFRGGHIDGNGLASCLYLQYYFHFTLRDVTFLNGFPYGLHVGKTGAEIVGHNLYFRTLKRGLAGNTAFFTEGNDSQYSDCVAIDYTTGFDIRGGANILTRIHSWGGPVPPRTGEKIPEMLINSVAFKLGGNKNMLCNAYADTAAIGFDVSGTYHMVNGAWFLNNAAFGLTEMTVVRQEQSSSHVVFDNCVFSAGSLKTKPYEGPGKIKWSNVMWQGFADVDHLPEGLTFETSCACEKADDFEFLPGGKVWQFTSPAGEFTAKNSCRSFAVDIPRKTLKKQFPNAGAGEALLLRIRATTPETKNVEVTLSHVGGKVWGVGKVPLTTAWQEIRLPFKDFTYYKHWGKMPPIAEGELPNVREMTCVRFMYGKWLCEGTEDKAHGFEVGSVRVVGQ